MGANKIWIKIKKIENIKSYCEVYNFETEKTHTYTANNLVVHNCHELGHNFLLHLTRRGSREPTKWNIATDLAVNTMLMNSGFELGEGWLKPDYNNTYTPEFLPNCKEIHNIHQKNAEMIYDELPDVPESMKQKPKLIAGRFDEHRENSQAGQGEKQQQENEWLQRTEEAMAMGQMKGNVPEGIVRALNGLKKSRLNWRALLQKYIQAELPSDTTWAKKSKRSVACGYYLPAELKEHISLAVLIDLSGSVGQEEFKDFFTEIVGIARAFRDRLTMRLFTFDTKLHTDLEVHNGNIAKIYKTSMRGGGGTSFSNPLTEMVKDKKYKPKVAIILTDGAGDNPITDENKSSLAGTHLIWCLSKNSTEDYVKGTGTIIKLREYQI